MIDVTIATYEQDIIEASVATPCWWISGHHGAPVQNAGPVLDKLDAEYAGCFILAKVNIDESPQLAAMFGVRSVPTGILIRARARSRWFHGGAARKANYAPFSTSTWARCLRLGRRA